MTAPTASTIACRGVALTLLLSALLVGAAAPQPTFRAQVDLVRLDVLAVRDGRPVPGLTKDDFEVRDNGVVQRVEHVSFAQVPLDVMLVLDTSRSVAGEKLRHLQDASHAFLAGLAPADRAGLLVFNETLAVESALTYEVARVHAAIDRVRGRGATALRDAMHAALLWPTRAEMRALILVFSDGLDTISWLSANEVTDTAHGSDAVVYGVAMGSAGDENQLLKRVAEATGGRLLDAGSSRQLRGVFLEILEEIRARYIVSYHPPPQEGWHDVRVSLRRGRGEVTARRRYYMPPRSQ